MLRKLCVALMLSASVVACSADDSGNSPPTVVLNVGNNETIEVGETFLVDIDADDPEGSCNSFDFRADPPGSTDTAQFLDDGCREATFSWAPIASDATAEGEDPMRLIFIVTDEAGQTTEKTVNLTITTGNGVPRFLNNASELYDPRTGNPVRISVEVRDDDSSEVELRIDDGPTGADFEQTSQFTGEFTWEPTIDQLKKRVHSATFIADDDLNDPVEFKVTIVIRSVTGGELKADSTSLDCPGEEVIKHAPLGLQRTTTDYQVSASLTAAGAGRYDEMFLYWTLGNPYSFSAGDSEEENSFESIQLEDDGTGAFSATIGNQANVIDAGKAVDVKYTICAIDKDSSDESAVVCVPSAGDFNLYYAFSAYRPDEQEECLEDGSDNFGEGNDTFDTATGISSESFGFFRTCEGNEDFHVLQVRPGESYLMAAIYNNGQDVTVEAYDDGRNPITLETSSCTGLSGLEVSVPENGSTSNFYLKVTGGSGVAYQTRAVQIQGGAGGCVDDAIEPNDDALTAAPAGDSDMISAEICTTDEVDVYGIDLNVGDELTVVHRFSNAQGNLDLTLFTPSQASIVSKDNINDGPAYTFGFDDEETLTYTAEESGTHYLLVFNNNESVVPYTLDFSIDAAPPCPDADQFSSAATPNHTQDDAAILMSSNDLTLSSLAVCPGRDDWYQRTEFNLGLVLGELSVTGGDGTLSDVTLEVIDLQGNVLDTGTVAGSALEFDFTPMSTAPVFYRVSTTSRVEYELVLIR